MNKSILALCTVALFTVAALAAAPLWTHGTADPPAIPKEAVVVLIPMSDSDTAGELTLSDRDGFVHIRGKVWNLTPGKHGFHIHEYGDLRDSNGESAGTHFNPAGESHGGPHDPAHHAGDLGNITADSDGVAKVDLKMSGFNLHFAFGRSIVVHAKPDDLKTQPSGDSGDRIAMGVIGVAEAKKR